MSKNEEFITSLKKHIVDDILMLQGGKKRKDLSERQLKIYTLRATKSLATTTYAFIERFDGWIGNIISFSKAAKNLSALFDEPITLESATRIALKCDASIQYVIRLIFYNLINIKVEDVFDQELVTNCNEAVLDCKIKPLSASPISPKHPFLIQTAAFLLSVISTVFSPSYFDAMINTMIESECLSNDSYERIVKARERYQVFQDVKLVDDYDCVLEVNTKLNPDIIWEAYRLLYYREIFLDGALAYINEMGLRLEHMVNSDEYILLSDLCVRYEKKDEIVKVPSDNKLKDPKNLITFRLIEKLDPENQIPMVLFEEDDFNEELDEQRLIDTATIMNSMELNEDTDEEEIEEELKRHGIRKAT